MAINTIAQGFVEFVTWILAVAIKGIRRGQEYNPAFVFAQVFGNMLVCRNLCVEITPKGRNDYRGFGNFENFHHVILLDGILKKLFVFFEFSSGRVIGAKGFKIVAELFVERIANKTTSA